MDLAADGQHSANGKVVQGIARGHKYLFSEFGRNERISHVITFDVWQKLERVQLVERDERISFRVCSASDENHVVRRTAILDRGVKTSDNRHCRNEDADDDGNGTDGH